MTVSIVSQFKNQFNTDSNELILGILTHHVTIRFRMWIHNYYRSTSGVPLWEYERFVDPWKEIGVSSMTYPYLNPNL